MIIAVRKSCRSRSRSSQKLLQTSRFPPVRSFASSDLTVVSSRPPAQVYSSLNCTEPMAYARGWALQQVLLQQRLDLRRRAEIPIDSDQILMLQHEPVYTLGRGADENYLTFLQQDDTSKRDALSRRSRGPQSARLSVDKPFVVTDETFWSLVDDLSAGAMPVRSPNNTPIYRIDRGGEVTFHGPGQLVVYPLLDLKRGPMRMDLHWYLRIVEEIIMEVLNEYDIVGERNEINTGVWVGDSKLAAVGVSSSRWITTHGFAINVSPDLDYFDTAVMLPCGIEERGVTSIEKVLTERGEAQHHVPSIKDISAHVLAKMQHVFDMEVNTNVIELE